MQFNMTENSLFSHYHYYLVISSCIAVIITDIVLIEVNCDNTDLFLSDVIETEIC